MSQYIKYIYLRLLIDQISKDNSDTQLFAEDVEYFYWICDKVGVKYERVY